MLRALPFATCFTLSVMAGAALAQTAPEAPVEAQIAPGSVIAAENPELYALFQAIGLYDVLEIMSIEGIDYADDLEAEMFPGQGGAAWPAMVAQTYSLERLTQDFEAAVPEDAFSADELDTLNAFFATEIGRRIVEGEILARREFIDPVVEEAANIVFREELAAENPRIDQLRAFNDANALIDLNVAGALNSNFAFYRGLVDGGAFDVELPEDLMLAEVWSQEPEIRAETELWLFSYQIVAYDALSDADMDAYITLSESPAGRVLNRTLFAAFDAMFEAVSYDLGAAAALFVAGEET